MIKTLNKTVNNCKKVTNYQPIQVKTAASIIPCKMTLSINNS
jgi:hypothetical protein